MHHDYDVAHDLFLISLLFVSLVDEKPFFFSFVKNDKENWKIGCPMSFITIMLPIAGLLHLNTHYTLSWTHFHAFLKWTHVYMPRISIAVIWDAVLCFRWFFFFRQFVLVHFGENSRFDRLIIKWINENGNNS